VTTELMLADLESLEKRLPTLEKKAKSGEKDAAVEAAVMARIVDALRRGEPARTVEVSGEDAQIVRRMQLLTSKPVLYVLNVDEGTAASGNELSRTAARMAEAQGASSVVISAAIEAEVAQLPPEEQREFLSDLGLERTGLDRVIEAGYGLLDLVTFFTVGPKEAHAWTVRRGSKAPQAAGAIHTDFEKGFIRAETIAYDDFVTYGGENGARDAGKLRLEGKDYLVRDGDVFHFRFNV
jgi:ribosome-binding ATPase